MENIEESSPFRITPTVQALGSALRGEHENLRGPNGPASGDRINGEPEKLWFKESSAKNLRNRDFLSPTTVLNTLYAEEQVCVFACGAITVLLCNFIIRIFCNVYLAIDIELFAVGCT